MIFFRRSFLFFIFLCFFCPSVFCARHLCWRAPSFFLVLRRMASDAAKKAAHFSLPFVCSFCGIISRLTLSFVAESYSAFYSLYAPLIYVRLYFTSCPVTVYTFSPRRMRICPLRRILDALCSSVKTSSIPSGFPPGLTSPSYPVVANSPR